MVLLAGFTRPALGANNLTPININNSESSPLTDIFETQPLKIDKPIYNMSVSGDVSFKSKKSLLRVILIDRAQNEYLVYETYPLISTSNQASFDKACRETCVLDGIQPTAIRIEGYGVIFRITDLLFSDNLSDINPPAGKAGIAVARED